MLGDIGLDKLHQHGRHIRALGRNCGFEGIVKTCFDVNIHAFCSFHRFDLSHLPPLEVRLNGFEYERPVVRKFRAAAIEHTPSMHLHPG